MNKGCAMFLLVVMCCAGLIIGYSTNIYGEGGEGSEHAHRHDHHHATAIPVPVVDLETAPATLKAQSPAKLTFYFKDSDGNPLQDLAITHERILHVIIISQDFSSFAHIHPEDYGPVSDEMRRKARFVVNYTFPRAGRYLVAADFGVKESYFSEQFTLDVAGEPGMGAVRKDLSRKKEFGEYEVALGSRPERIIAGKETLLRYTIKSEGKPVTNIEPYLGAAMHLAIVGTDLNQFIHAHGDRPGADGGGHHAAHGHGSTQEKYGPEIESQVIFPVKGTYKIFSEIKHRGKVLLLDFMVDVE